MQRGTTGSCCLPGAAPYISPAEGRCHVVILQRCQGRSGTLSLSHAVPVPRSSISSLLSQAVYFVHFSFFFFFFMEPALKTLIQENLSLVWEDVFAVRSAWFGSVLVQRYHQPVTRGSQRWELSPQPQALHPRSQLVVLLPSG